MEYKVIPFPNSKDSEKGNSEQVTEELEKVIKNYSKKGWQYLWLENVTTYIQAESGCFGFNSKSGYTRTKQMIVFQKQN